MLGYGWQEEWASEDGCTNLSAPLDPVPLSHCTLCSCMFSSAEVCSELIRPVDETFWLIQRAENYLTFLLAE